MKLKKIINWEEIPAHVQEEIRKAKWKLCLEIENYCIEQGLPSNGSTFDLMYETYVNDETDEILYKYGFEWV